MLYPDLFYLIGQWCDFLTQMALRHTCRMAYRNVKILEIPYKLEKRLNDDLLEGFPYLTHLDARGNPKITDKSIEKLVHLTNLNASVNPNITDKSLRKLFHLVSIGTCGNENITNKCKILLRRRGAIVFFKYPMIY